MGCCGFMEEKYQQNVIEADISTENLPKLVLSKIKFLNGLDIKTYP